MNYKSVKTALNVYVHTEKECEQKLAELIQEMKAELGITGKKQYAVDKEKAFGSFKRNIRKP